MHRVVRALLVLCLAALAVGTPAAQRSLTRSDTDSQARAERPLLRARPEAVGLSSSRLTTLGQVLRADIEAGRMPGAVVAIARRNKLVYLEAFGFRDAVTRAPMTVDTVFNIASMTKPLTTVAALSLYERGLLSMDDPLEMYLPEFAKRRVAVLSEDGASILREEPARRSITLQDLMRHTSGIVYGNRGTTVLHKMYPASSNAASAMTSTALVTALSQLPLLHQPGSTWDYGFGLDLAGVVVEHLEHRSLGEILRERVFGPLQMSDTGFQLPAGSTSRYAKPLPRDPITGQAQAVDPDLTRPLGLQCGGSCAYSTATDYLRFAQMLLNGGALGDVRILGRKTVEYMTSNQLGPEVVNLVGNADPTRADYGFGLGVAVRTTPGVVKLMGSVGDFSWPGASGTNWWVDPKEQLAVVFMAQTPGALRWHYRQVINALVEQAIVD